ncbi:OstA-like protein [Flavobacterium sp. H4147]
MKKSLFFIFCMLFLGTQFISAQKPKSAKAPKNAQAPKKINIEHSDFLDVDQVLVPDGILLTGNVKVNHDGVVLTCNKAYYFQKENYLKAFGNVQLVQGDTLFLNSKYAEYSGNIKKAFATGDAVMTSPDATLQTDTINFDRNIQQVFYNTKGTIVNKDNTLVSKSGRYYVAEKKFQFLTEVIITNPKYVIKSNHLDYYSNSGHTYLFGPSTITSKANYIYTEKGFYDTKKNLAHFLRRSYIKYDDRLIEGDSLYYNRNIEFASATRNVKITDSINRGLVKGHYAEIYKLKDSMFVTKRAVAINLVENDSVYIHGKKLMVTGKEGERILRAFNNVRFYKTDMSGKCDSIHSNSKTALTKLIGHPILWNGESQITGDIMHLIGDNKTRKLDSLKVLNNTFIISKDTLGTGYNQVKGLNLFGKFREGKLHDVDVIKNTEVIYFMRNDANELIGINKNVSSKINMILENNAVDNITFFNRVDGDIYPEADLPENARKLRGFVWRGDERIKSKDDIFSEEDNELNDKLIKEGKDEEEKGKNVPLKVRKETLNYDKKKPAAKTEAKPKEK